MSFWTKFFQKKNTWVGMIALLLIWLFALFGEGMYYASVVSINESKAKNFEQAIKPIAFVPNWRVGNYVEDRATLDAYDVALNDYISLPDAEDIHTDWNSYFTYMNMHMGAYLDEDREVGAGSHVWVDIRAPINTPVFSIAHGIVYKVKNLKSDKYVVVKHKNVSYKWEVGDYYSAYLHLAKVNVKPGDLVNMGTVVGTVGMTGITSTPHLHFQIDKDNAPFHPFWPFTLSEAYDVGYSFFDAVNKGLNQDDVRRYTVDPMDFIASARPASGGKSALDLAKKESQSHKPTPPSKESRSLSDDEWGNTIGGEEVLNEIVGEEVPSRDAGAGKVREVDEEEGKIKEEKEVEYSGSIHKTKNDDQFPDLSPDHPNYNSIQYFVSKGVLNGYEDGTFGPNNTLTRSELLAVVLGALDLQYDGELLLGLFKDVPKDHWVNPLISNAVDRGIITTSRKVFEPNRSVTRAEFLAILVFASEVELNDVVALNTKKWSDVDPDHWSAKYAAIAHAMELFPDTDASAFGVNDPVKRAEVAHAMYAYMQAIGHFRN